MHPVIIIGTVGSLIVDVAMGQIPRSTERISSLTCNPWAVTLEPGECPGGVPSGGFLVGEMSGKGNVWGKCPWGGCPRERAEKIFSGPG